MMKNAIDQLIDNSKLIENFGRIGLVVNQASTAQNYIPTCEIVYMACQKNKNSCVTTLFGPQHGYAQTEQDNMKETKDGEFQFLDGKKVPLYSLYSKTREPSQEQLEHVDTILVDLQDIGCRVYTYMLTLAGCLRSAAKYQKKVVVLDRNNPIGLCYLDKKSHKWMRIEGNTLDTKWNSFVGWYDIPMRHGLSLGELGNYFIQCDELNVDYEVIPVENLSRTTTCEQLKNQSWTMPSPNIPSWLSAFFFPSFVILEGTNVSEGRGTTIPFQLIGAPWLDVQGCISFLKKNQDLFTLNKIMPLGLTFREHHFRPTFNKHMNEICHGIQFHFENTENVNLFALGMTFLYFCKIQHPHEFFWSTQPYEYNFKDLPINLILGDEKWISFLNELNLVDKKKEFADLLMQSDKEASSFAEKIRDSCFIYT